MKCVTVFNTKEGTFLLMLHAEQEISVSLQLAKFVHKKRLIQDQKKKPGMWLLINKMFSFIACLALQCLPSLNKKNVTL